MGMSWFLIIRLIEIDKSIFMQNWLQEKFGEPSLLPEAKVTQKTTAMFRMALIACLGGCIMIGMNFGAMVSEAQTTGSVDQNF